MFKLEITPFFVTLNQGGKKTISQLMHEQAWVFKYKFKNIVRKTSKLKRESEFLKVEKSNFIFQTFDFIKKKKI